ncbi:MAG: FAD-dependent oxidoreductase [Rhodobacteraceae bacterium]|nr:FAD-dependent oxidoreductase [Paracoccaceae bacterium]
MPPLIHAKTGPRIVVVGAGIIGLTSALYLAQAGFSVVVVEREPGPCENASKANAGQLLYDRIAAMAAPGFPASQAKALFQSDQGVHVSGLLHPGRWPWAGAFLRQCTTAAWQRNTSALLEIAHRSRSAMTTVTNRYALDFDWRKPGKLVLYSTAAGLADAHEKFEFQTRFGGRHEVLSAAECVTREPALKGTTREIAGGIYLPDAEVGDCRKFGIALASVLVDQLDVQINYGVEILELVRDKSRIQALRTRNGLINGDVFVLAAGKANANLAPGRFLGKKPITGIKGISLTFPLGDAAPDLSVTDTTGKFVVLRLGNRVRVAGYAMFSDDPEITQSHVEKLTEKARGLMPHAALFNETPDTWVGFRPTTPDDLPMIGRVHSENLFVNAGHGSLGWTLALGSAEILQEKIGGAFGRKDGV